MTCNNACGEKYIRMGKMNPITLSRIRVNSPKLMAALYLDGCHYQSLAKLVPSCIVPQWQGC